MNEYRVRLVVKAKTERLSVSGPKAIEAALAIALWPRAHNLKSSKRDFNGARSLGSHGKSIGRGNVKFLIDRDLEVDTSVVVRDKKLRDMPLVKALEKQFCNELAEYDLASTQLSVTKVVVISNHTLDNEAREYEKQRIQRVKPKRELTDITGHARILGLRGEPPEANWPYVAISAYEDGVKMFRADAVRAIDGRLKALGIDDLDKLIRDLETTAEYVRQIKTAINRTTVML